MVPHKLYSSSCIQSERAKFLFLLQWPLDMALYPSWACNSSALNGNVVEVGRLRFETEHYHI